MEQKKKVEKISMLRISMLRKMTKVRIGQKCDTEEKERRRGQTYLYSWSGRLTKNIFSK